MCRPDDFPPYAARPAPDALLREALDPLSETLTSILIQSAEGGIDPAYALNAINRLAAKGKEQIAALATTPPASAHWFATDRDLLLEFVQWDEYLGDTPDPLDAAVIASAEAWYEWRDEFPRTPEGNDRYYEVAGALALAIEARREAQAGSK